MALTWQRKRNAKLTKTLGRLLRGIRMAIARNSRCITPRWHLKDKHVLPHAISQGRLLLQIGHHHSSSSSSLRSNVWQCRSSSSTGSQHLHPLQLHRHRRLLDRLMKTDSPQRNQRARRSVIARSSASRAGRQAYTSHRDAGIGVVHQEPWSSSTFVLVCKL